MTSSSTPPAPEGLVAGMGDWETVPGAGWEAFSAMRARLRAGMGGAPAPDPLAALRMEDPYAGEEWGLVWAF